MINNASDLPEQDREYLAGLNNASDANLFFDQKYQEVHGSQRGRIWQEAAAELHGRREADVLFLDEHAKGNDFAESLVAQYKSKGKLSPKQWVWVHKLADERRTPKAAPTYEADGETKNIVPLLLRAKEKLTYPNIRHQNVKLGVFGANSKYAGQVRVKFRYEESEEFQYGGRIDTEGKIWLVRMRCSKTSVLNQILDFDSDPQGKASVSGRLTGSCCFCGRPLETKESVGVGYGPICADNYGLPWGSTEEYDAAKEAAQGELF